MTQVSVRSVYQLILRVHPAAFRGEFGEEMLWIFDEECRRGRALRMLFDGVLSLVRQRCVFQRAPKPVTAGIGLIISDDGIGAARLMQAGLLVSVLIAGFLLVLSPKSASSLSLRWPESVLHCTLTLQAPPPVLPLRVHRLR